MRAQPLLQAILLTCLAGLAGCGGGGEEEPAAVGLPPATPVPELEGVWCGPGASSGLPAA